MKYRIQSGTLRKTKKKLKSKYMSRGQKSVEDNGAGRTTRHGCERKRPFLGSHYIKFLLKN